MQDNQHSLKLPQDINMRLNNIKVTLRFEKPFFKKRCTNEKITIKHDSATLVFYTHSPHLCNLTGIKSQERVQRIIKTLESEFDNPCQGIKIDSCLVTQKSLHPVRLEKIKAALPGITPMYRTEFVVELTTGETQCLKFIHPLFTLLSACYVKPHDVYRDYPTINIFHTGTFQLIGGHSFEQLHEAAKIAQRLTVACRKE